MNIGKQDGQIIHAAKFAKGMTRMLEKDQAPKERKGGQKEQ